MVHAYRLNDMIVAKFENRRWNIPATIYSRPLVLDSGTNLSPKNLETWLTLLHYDKNTSEKTGSYQKKGDTYTIYTRQFDYGDGEIDPQQTLTLTIKNNQISQSYSSNGNHARLEPIKIGSIYPENNEDRILLTKDTLPKSLIDALIATEDRSFYTHKGISLRGTTRALWSNISGGSTQGGSTLTQQLIKNFYLNSERTLKRKFNEAIMALLLERRYSKEDILLAYVNEINLGQNGNQSVNGFATASQFYFNKPIGELRLDQYAFLVGVAKGPSYYNPRKHPERATQRRDTVLDNMLVTGVISQEDYREAISRPLDVVKQPSMAKSRFPDFFDVVQRELKKYYRQSDLQNAGLRIISSLDPIAQNAANQAMSNRLKKLGKNLQGALVSADPYTGELLAIVGSQNDFTGYNRALDANRQVGSLLKPIIYLTALQSGEYNLASNIKDEPITYKTGGKGWTPKNYGGISHGDVPLITALANSYNQAAVNVGMQFGVETFQKQLHNFGIERELPSSPAILLGAVELSPMEVLGMYQIFASRGYHTPIHSVKRVISEQGEVLKRTADDIESTHRYPTALMDIINFGMQKVITSGTAKRASSLGKVAGKTGTTNSSRDAWFAGFSDNYVSVVWVGRDDNTPIGLTGGSGALPIWQEYMSKLTLKAVHSPQNSEEISWQWLDQDGKLAEEYCQGVTYLPVLTKFMPEEGNCLTGLDDYTHDEYHEEFGDTVVDTQDEYSENLTPPRRQNIPTSSESEDGFYDESQDNIQDIVETW